VMMAAHCTGRARLVLELATDWARTRRQFGRPIGEFQGVSFKLADMETEIRAAWLLTLQASWKLDQGTLVPVDASVAKLYASEMLGRVADEGVQIFGGMGVSTELPMERYWRDARVERIWEGTSEIHRDMIGRTLLRG
jgi:acyl-CoA dehydrogenase